MDFTGSTGKRGAFLLLLFVMGLFVGGLLFSSAPVEGAVPVLRLDGTVERYEVGPYLEILEDPAGKRSIEEVSAPAASSQFEPVKTRTLNRGISDSTYWLRFSLCRIPGGFPSGIRHNSWLIDLGWPFFNNVQAYLVSDQAGSEQPQIVPISFQRVFRPIGGSLSKDQGLLARLPVKSSLEQTLYLRLQTDSVFFLYPVLNTVRNYLQASTLRMLWYGLYFGLLLALLLYNLFLYFCLRDSGYLWYVASIAAVGAYFAGMDRLTYEFLIAYPPPDFVRLNLATLSISLIALLWFSRYFLNSAQRSPRLDLAVRGLLAALLATLLLVPWAGTIFLNHCYLVLGGLVPFALVAMAFTCWRSGYRPARFLFLSWTLYGGCGLVYALTFQGWLPFNYLSFHSFQIGSVLEAILLSFALADRINLLRQEREELSHSERRHKELAVTDSLTGLYNRRYFTAQIDLEIQAADRLGQKLTLMMLDVDNFKLFNDRYGHQEGDRVLACLGKIMLACVRSKDVACRYGGEEFAIILPGGQNSTAVEIYERINKELQAYQFGTDGQKSGRITMSIGVAEHLPGEPTENLVRRADQALYEAKARGRNQIIIASREPDAVFFSCIAPPPSGDQPHL